mmetsp:Transcript_66811/g.198813  ORF Transcript_66811/g.198813 Transcript_66811/m.198813 type:complete len:272 (+) Transcript_66811:652-1467(+)
MPHLREPGPELPQVRQELRDAVVLAPAGPPRRTCHALGDPQGHHQHAAGDQGSHCQVDGSRRHEKRRPHQEEASHIDEGDTSRYSEDRKVLCFVTKWGQAAEEARLETSDPNAAQGISKHHPADPVRLERDDHHGDEEHGEQHGDHGDVGARPRGDEPEDDAVPHADDEAPDVHARHRGAEVVGHHRVVVLNPKDGLDLVLEPEECRVAGVHREDDEEALPVGATHEAWCFQQRLGKARRYLWIQGREAPARRLPQRPGDRAVTDAAPCAP